MASRVTVDITARDLTRAEVARMRQNFRRLGQDLERTVTARTRQNWDRLGQSVSRARQDLNQLRGAIPDAEFFRLDDAIRQSQRTLQRGFTRVGDRAFNRMVDRIRDVEQGFRDLDQAAEIRIRVDDSALRRADNLLDRWRRDAERQAVRVRVNPDVRDGRSIGQRLVRTLTSPFRTAGSALGGILSDGLGQGIIGAFRTAGPVGMAIMTAVILGAVTMLGAAIAGILVLAIGGAMVGLGVKLAMGSERAKKAWENASGRIKKAFEGAGDPLIGTIEKATGMLAKLAEDFAPHFKNAMEAASPFLDDFLDNVDAGLRKLGKHSFKDIMGGFNAFLIAFGPQFEDFLEELGKSLGALGRTVKENSTEIAIALRGVLGVINFIIDAVNFLARAWVFLFHTAIASLASMVDAFADVVDGLLSGFGMILTGAEKSFSWIPGIGEKITESKRQFDLFRESTVNNLRQTAESIRGVSRSIEETNAKNKLRADISDINSKIKAAKEQLQTVTDKKVQAKIRADIAQLLEAKRIAEGQLQALNGKTVHTYVITHLQARTEGSHGTQLGYAHGGIRGLSTAATGGVRSNMTLVGEQGPELINLAPGSRVRSNPDTDRLLGQSSGGGGAVFEFRSSGRRSDDMLLEIIREAIHQRGGDPVQVLGGN